MGKRGCRPGLPGGGIAPRTREAVLYGGGIHLSMDTVSWHDQRVYALAALPDPDGRRWGPPSRIQP